MMDQGKTVREVLRTQIPAFDNMDTYGRYLAEKGLRTSVTRRRSRLFETRAKRDRRREMTSIGEDLSDWRFARVVKESPNEAHDAIVDDLSAASIPWVAPDILNGAYGRS